MTRAEAIAEIVQHLCHTHRREVEARIVGLLRGCPRCTMKSLARDRQRPTRPR